MRAAGASPLVPLLGHIPQPCTCSAPHPVSHAGRHSVLHPVLPMGQCREGSMGMAWSWSPLPLAGVTPGSTGCPGRGTGLVPAPRLPGRALPANPSPLIPLHHPTHVPLALCSAPDSHPASSLPSNHSFILQVRKETAHCQISYLRGNRIEFY